MSTFNTFSREDLATMNLTKGEMLKALGLFPNHVDTALPQAWLNWAADNSQFTYEFLVYSCYTSYIGDPACGKVESFCREIQEWLDSI